MRGVRCPVRCMRASPPGGVGCRGSVGRLPGGPGLRQAATRAREGTLQRSLHAAVLSVVARCRGGAPAVQGWDVPRDVWCRCVMRGTGVQGPAGSELAPHLQHVRRWHGLLPRFLHGLQQLGQLGARPARASKPC